MEPITFNLGGVESLMCAWPLWKSVSIWFNWWIISSKLRKGINNWCHVPSILIIHFDLVKWTNNMIKWIFFLFFNFFFITPWFYYDFLPLRLDLREFGFGIELKPVQLFWKLFAYDATKLWTQIISPELKMNCFKS